MHKGIIASLILSVLLVIFALQNTEPVQLNLWFWSFQSSLALLVIVLLVTGALLGYLILLPTLFSKNKIIRDKESQLRKAKSSSGAQQTTGRIKDL